MFPEFDYQSQNIMSMIEDEKQRFGVVGSESLLLALMNKNTVCGELLKEYGVTTEDLEAELSELILLRKSFSNNYTLKLLEIIKNARTIATLEESKFVFSEHLFYALLTTTSSVALNILERLDLDPNILLEDLSNIYSFHSNESLSNNYLVNITKEAKSERLNPFIGRSDIIDKIIRILSKKQKNNPMLIGSAGVGKSALVEGVAMKMLQTHPNINIYRLDLGTIIAGTKYRGDLEERLIEVIERIKNPYSVVFIDEIHNIVGSGSSEGTLDIANILKPILARSEIKCIGATTLEEYYRYIEKDKALSRRFQNVFVDEASLEEAYEIIKGIAYKYEEFHQVKYKDQILKYIIASSCFLANRKLPDKAIDIMDEAGLLCHLNKRQQVNKADVDKIVFESMGIKYDKINARFKSIKNYRSLSKYYQQYFINLGIRKTILNVQIGEENLDLLIEDIKHVFNIKDEVILKLDLERFQENFHSSSLVGAPAGYVGYESGGILTEHVLKYPISLIIINNYFSGAKNITNQIENILNDGSVIDSKGRLINFRNTFFVFIEKNLKPAIGYLESETSEKMLPQIDEIIKGSKQKTFYLKKINQVLERMKNHNYNLVLDIFEMDKNTYTKVLCEISNLDNFKPNRTYVIKYINEKVLFEMKK
ncbi:MAG: AAA family ATPase [Bacilli bacterium]|nr:AAA family ATPase [Bacilli bacterium]